MPPQNIWTIHNNPPPNNPAGNNLNGLHIQQTSSGFQITAPNITNVLATTNASAPPFEFTVVYGGSTYNIHVKSAPQGANGSGSWVIPSPVEDPTDGDFTAQAGSGVDADEEDAASSAKA